MGVGKTIQILTFLAWCIESGKFPELAKACPPFRPNLIIVPLILLETRNWEREMERFFADEVENCLLPSMCSSIPGIGRRRREPRFLRRATSPALCSAYFTDV
jgi:SNF2 family DNA or RNA helicase